MNTCQQNSTDLRFSRLCSKVQGPRRGGIAIQMAVVMSMIFGFTALTIDVGFVFMTRTQLQSASDASALAGGTELRYGLGRFATATSSEVEANIKAAADLFASSNRVGDLSSAYLDQNRDVRMGRATYSDGIWYKEYDATPYNMVEIQLHRDIDGSVNGDRPLGLFFAPVLGTTQANLSTLATAAVLPARGYVIAEQDELLPLIPFAFRAKLWRRFEAAQDWYTDPANNVTPGQIPQIGDAGYPMWDDPLDDPDQGSIHLFHQQDYDNQGNLIFDNQGNPVYRQDFFDDYSYSESTGQIDDDTPDGWLEADLYPESTGGAIGSPGNAGTIDLGDTNNSSSDLRRQIEEGINYDDYQEMDGQNVLTEGQFILDPGNNITATVNGDTGLSAGPIGQGFEEILGDARVIALFDEDVVFGSGNNVVYTLVDFAGVRPVYQKLTGNDKRIWIQMAPVIDGTALPDLENEVGSSTTLFTPVILID